MSNGSKQDYMYKVAIQFHVDSPHFIRHIEQSLLATFPDTSKLMCRLDVYRKEGAHITVKGYGKPFPRSFANPGHASDGWINDNEATVGNSTLIDIIGGWNFFFMATAPANVLEKHWLQITEAGEEVRLAY